MTMLEFIKHPLYRLLRWSERYTKTDMVHFFSANFWLNLSRVISIGSGMLLTIAFANLLSPEAFGTYKYVIAAAGLVGTFSLNGLSTALMRAVAQGKKNVVPALVRNANLWSIPGSIASLGIGAYYFAQGNDTLGWAFVFIGVSNCFGGGFGAAKGIWQAAGEFRISTLSGIPRILVPFFIILFTILFTENVTYILLAYFASSLAASWAGYRFALWWFDIHGADASPQDVAEAKKYGKQMSALSFFQIASGQIDQLLLFHFVGPASLAIYALALSPVEEAQTFLNNFLTILFPKIAVKSEEEVHQTLPLRIKQMFLVAITVTICYIAVVPFLFTYLFPKYLASIVVSQVLALTILLQPKGVIDTFFVVHGQIASRSKVILISQAVEFALFFALIPLYGLWGAVAATILSELFAAIVYLWMYAAAKKKSSL